MTEYKLEDISISKLQLDGKNPRIPKSLHGEDEETIITYMIKNSSITELMESICENGYFSGEPLIVVPVNPEKPEDGHIVVEGNRRTTALKLLHNPELAKVQKNKIQNIANYAKCKKPKKIPSLVAKNHDEVQRYLGFKHITGIKSWKALEKARYLNTLRSRLKDENKNITLAELSKELASMIGSRSDYVKRVIIAYDIYLVIEDNDFFNIHGLNDTTFYFTTLIDSLSRTSIAIFLGVNFENHTAPLEKIKINHIKEWCQWFFEKTSENTTRVKGISKQLTILAKIIDNERAFKEFRGKRKSIDEAIFLTDHIDEVFIKSILRAKNYIYEAKSLTSKIDQYYDGIGNDLKEIASICREINTIKDSKKKDEFDV